MSASLSKPSPDETSKRRWSKDFPPVSALKQSNDYELYQSIIDFLRLYEDKKDLRRFIKELQEIPQQREKLETKKRTGLIVSTATLAAGAGLALASSRLTEELSLAAMAVGAAAGVSGVAAGIGVNSNFKRKIENEQKKKQEAEAELINTLKELETRLNNVQTVCKELRESERDVNEREQLHKLEKKIQKFKDHTVSLQRMCAKQEESVSQIIDEIETIERELNDVTIAFKFTLKRLNDKYADH
ncbi:uncharacterized protein LOC117379322 [Periophthalmus magnuspinnatus]|uniref:uncharacterized protein LOC117379322 n=1 Tax=Periophthalmus magnuspinnatus TaxID=409849 RepID=UPI00145A5981|nr:uncharacterized protein LOC117379322 [Periophthalmus magnuspinnatus]